MRRRVVGLAVAVVLLAAPGAAQEPPEPAPTATEAAAAPKPREEALLVKRLKLTGRWVAGGLEVRRVELRDPRKDPGQGRVTAAIDAVGPEPNTIHLGPMTVEWNEETEFIGTSPGKLEPGASVEAKGKGGGPGLLLAQSIEGVSPTGDEVELLGPVASEEHRPDGSMTLVVFGIHARVPRGVSSRGVELGRRLDQRRPERQWTLSVFGRPLTIGGEAELSNRYFGNTDLDTQEPNDSTFRFEPGLQLEGTYFIAPNVLVFIQGSGGWEETFPLGEGEDREDVRFLKRDQHWLYLGDIPLPGMALQLGRQAVQEPREWWWDRDMDALRAYFDAANLHLEIGVAEDFWRSSTAENEIPPEFDDVFRVLGNAAWSWREKQRLDFFALTQNDSAPRRQVHEIVPDDLEDQVVGSDPTSADLTWLGARASGEFGLGNHGEVTYWADYAWVHGQEFAVESRGVDCPPGLGEDCDDIQSRRHPVNGWAVDLGTTWATELPRRPAFTLGYAYGSGNPRDIVEADRSFRQTGLQDNNVRFRGVNRFRYYGELLRPELSNLQVVTGSAGIRFFRRSSLELLYHYYRQARPAPYLFDARIDADPNGEDPELGHEWDAVLGIRDWTHVDLELIGSLFLAGKAYGERQGDVAHGIFFKINYNF